MFEWDDEKNAANHRKHGISFEDILPIFEVAEVEGLILEDRRQDYGEERFVFTVSPHGQIYHVTFAWRDDRIRLISARRANPREVQDYERRKHH
jgi:hypothetical protein